MISCTDVGPLRDRLGERLIQSLADEFIDSPGLDATGGFSPVGGARPGEESIFDYGSSIGLLPESEGDYWIHDAAASTWTRIVVVPMKEFYHPSEGVERSSIPGPRLADLGNLIRTITSDGKVVQDDWRKTEMAEGPCEVGTWTGSCVFRESWAATSEEIHQIDRAADVPGPLVFTNAPEYSLLDDLSGEPLPAPLVTVAKREEITETYRRAVWSEKLVEDCLRDTGKPPIPVRWVVTNKGDRLHPNVRCRLVAKHLAAKYGGKEMEDLFAAMPPFELVRGSATR